MMYRTFCSYFSEHVTNDRSIIVVKNSTLSHFRQTRNICKFGVNSSSGEHCTYSCDIVNLLQLSFILLQGDIGLNVAQMLVELIRDNRKIVDRITQDQIRMFVDLLQVNKVLLKLYYFMI